MENLNPDLLSEIVQYLSLQDVDYLRSSNKDLRSKLDKIYPKICFLQEKRNGMIVNFKMKSDDKFLVYDSETDSISFEIQDRDHQVIFVSPPLDVNKWMDALLSIL